MSKYIIKNCPARVLFTDGYFCRQADGNILCQDCTKCVLKQIVKYCLDQNLKYDTTACDILDILDIQEVK
jgi:hypothetical protein